MSGQIVGNGEGMLDDSRKPMFPSLSRLFSCTDGPGARNALGDDTSPPDLILHQTMRSSYSDIVEASHGR